ncbi:MAG: hypothetical protein HQK87_08425 [Nitrospinae bacterium]|nr:hypothetical protein [Nitrospinota bacterium]
MGTAGKLIAAVTLALVGGTACDLADDARAASTVAPRKVTYNDSDERNAYAYGTPSPERRTLVVQVTREQRMRYCKEMFGAEGIDPTAPAYRPAPGDLCYSVWKETVLDPQLARFAAYYRK